MYGERNMVNVIKGLCHDLLGLWTLNGSVIAVISLTELEAYIRIVMYAVATISTIIMTIHKLRKK
jgi:hypothetical protein